MMLLSINNKIILTYQLKALFTRQKMSASVKEKWYNIPNMIACSKIARQDHTKIHVHFETLHTCNFLTGVEGLDFGTSCSLSLRL